ncbi:MAG: hypothetical protein MK085_10860, partial [Phycisphaerales bacterium]|nr:hypothetical protein [Phycisphaerales bacterium]
MHEAMLDVMGLFSAAAETAAAGGEDRFMRFLGRLHPLVVHFPIGLGLTAAGVELINIIRRKAMASPFAFTATGLAAGFAVIAAFFGWLNADYEGPGPKTALFLHRWIGTATAVALVVVFLCGVAGRTGRRISALNGYRWGLVISGVLLIIGSHFGGEMVYGRGYLTKVLFASGSEPATPEGDAAQTSDAADQADASKATAQDTSPVVFRTDIEPLLQAHCVDCHGADKQKGDLRLDTAAAIFAGDRTWWVVEPGDPGKSELVNRIILPEGHVDAMPPDGPPLDAKDVELIRTWISQGALYETDGKTVKPGAGAPAAPAKESEAASSVKQEDAVKAPTVDQVAIDQAVAALQARGVLVNPIAQDTDEWEINASLANPVFADADLEKMSGMEPVLAWLNLARSGVTDAGMPELRGFGRIQKLRLDNTAISDGGIAPLLALEQLRSLNLYGTKVTDAGLATLVDLPNLSTVYCANTGVTPEGLEKIKAAHADITFVGPAPPPPVEATAEKPAAVDPDKPVAFATDIAPIFASRCTNCHGAEKAKGKLRLDSAAEIFAGDRGGWVVDPGNADKSVLVERISYPAGHEDVMPPKGPTLEPAQIALIKAWINQGASY